MATEGDLQAEDLFTMTFITQKNSISEEKVEQKASREPLLCPNADPLRWVIHLRDHGVTPSTY